MKYFTTNNKQIKTQYVVNHYCTHETFTYHIMPVVGAKYDDG